MEGRVKDERPTHDYVARAACGCVRAVAADLADKWTAATVADFIKDGYTVERMPLAEACSALLAGMECNHRAAGEQLALDL